MKRTKVVCTIGPASEKEATLEAMIEAGMNVARLNMSHSDYEWHRTIIRRLRKVAEKLNEPLPILLDLQGPKIRVGERKEKDNFEKGWELKSGQTVIFTTKREKEGCIPIDYPKLHQEIKKGERILLADGLIECLVESTKGEDIIVRVINGGILLPHQGVNLPDTQVSLKSLTLKDKRDIVFAVEEGVDFIALSFVRDKNDLLELRRLINQAEKMLQKKKMERNSNRAKEKFSSVPIKIIAKIEKQEAVKNFDEILAVSDGIMVARGDLALNISHSQVPLVQKEIIEKCRQAAKPVIVATEMLASMEKTPRPTRAEISDVANAVIDHTDAVMLSGETATGTYPVETVKTMSKIIKETEASRFDDLELGGGFLSRSLSSDEEIMATLASVAARLAKAKAILLSAFKEEKVRLISRVRSEVPILVGAPFWRTVRQLNLSWGVYPFFLPKKDSLEKFLKEVLTRAKKRLLLKKGDKIVFLSDKGGFSQTQDLIGIKRL
jgi:pyruvate kinase